MPPWFAPTFTRFECARYCTGRIVTVKQGAGFYRGMLISNPDHVNALDGLYGSDGSYNMYVSGYTWDWKSFIDRYGIPPSFTDGTAFNAWRKDKMTPSLSEFILKKDLVFEVDHAADKGLQATVPYVTAITNNLASRGWPFHVLFSGGHGYHIIAEDCERYFTPAGIECFARSINALAYAAIELAGKVLDEALAGQAFKDMGQAGRDYADASIHYSPMMPQGLRKAGYSVTEHGTVCLPVSKSDVIKAQDKGYYDAARVIKMFRIKGRGWLDVWR